MKKTIKRLFSVIFLVLISSAIGTNSYARIGASPYVSDKQAKFTAEADMEQVCGVTSQQIIDYLTKFGYRVISLAPANDGTCNVIATTKFPYHTLVYCTESIITGHVDLPY